MTMQCTQLPDLLDDYLDGVLSPLQQTALEQHLGDCSACQQQVLFAKQLQSRLASMPYPAPSGEFVTRVLQTIAAPQKKPYLQRYGFAAGFITAAVASVGLWLALISHPGVDNTPGVDLYSVELVAEQTQQVSLVFNSPVDIDNAALKLELPSNIELAGHSTKRQLEWQTSLRKGTNRLILPLIAHGKTNGPLQASITSGGKTKTFYLKCKTLFSPLTQKSNQSRLTI